MNTLQAGHPGEIRHAPAPKPTDRQKVKKLAEIAEGLRQGKDFPVTRLTTIKSLCGEPEAAAAFALFLAQRIQMKMGQEQSPKRYRELVDRAVKELKPYLTDPAEERKERLYSLCREMEAEQDEYKKIGWVRVRMLRARIWSWSKSPSSQFSGIRGTDLGLSGCQRLCRALRRSVSGPG